MQMLHEMACQGFGDECRDEFPMLDVKSNGHPFIYLNSAATALTPTVVLDAMDEYYKEFGVNIFRGVDTIAYRATQAFEASRQKVADFIGAKRPEEIVFTRGTTAAINLVAQTYGETNVREGSKIIVSATEHHANFLPWQQLAKRKGADFVVAPVNERGQLEPSTLEELIDDRTVVVAFAHISNVLGAMNDVRQLSAIAHAHGAVTVVDGAQGVVHDRVRVREDEVDFYAFSAHKLFGPTGVGVLYGRMELLEAMPPAEFGGEMIDRVDKYDSTFRQPPWRFEAGTMPIAEAIGLGAAIDFVNDWGYCGMQKRVFHLGTRMMEGLKKIPGITVYNPENAFSGVISYNIDGVHPHDASTVYDREGISLRAGHHCSQPTMKVLGQNATLRASVAFYNSDEEIDTFLKVTEETGDWLDVLF